MSKMAAPASVAQRELPMALSLAQVRTWLVASDSASTLVGGDVALGVRAARVHTDTRSVQPGDLFVALRGESFDANLFLAQAQAAGAVAAICDSAFAPELQRLGLPGITVVDTRLALGALAKHWREQFSLPLIGVTGSNGKTTVTQMLASILSAAHGEAALATHGNLNNDIGVPLTLLRLRSHHRMAVVELGMNHPGEIAMLAAMAQPTVALVNNAQREHLEFMHSTYAVAQENGAVLRALPGSGVAVFPCGDAFAPLWHELAGARAVVGFSLAMPGQLEVAGTFESNATTRSSTTGEAGHTPAQAQAQAQAHADCEVRAPQPVWNGHAWSVRAQTPVGAVNFSLQVAGLHNVRNALAACACALAAGVPLVAIAQGLAAFEPVNGRSKAIRLDLNGRACTLVDDSYNANPDSVRAAVAVLADLPGPRLLVLGDMGEVGEQGALFHAQIGTLARELGVEQVFTLGALSKATSDTAQGGQHFGHIDGLIAAVVGSVLVEAGVGVAHGRAAGRVVATTHTQHQVCSVLVKGSRFMRMERVVDALVKAAHAATREAPTCS